MRTLLRTLHKVQFKGERVFARFLAFDRNDNAENLIPVLVALTLCAMRFNFAPFKPG